MKKLKKKEQQKLRGGWRSVCQGKSGSGVYCGYKVESVSKTYVRIQMGAHLARTGHNSTKSNF